MIDAPKFFATIRTQLFAGTLTQRQVDGINAILAEWVLRALSDLRWLAYMLATVYWETGQRMWPISEEGGNAYFFRMYDIAGERPGVARLLGNLFAGDGILFHGAGLVQLTGRRNFEHMTQLIGARFGVDLEKNPEKALVLEIAIAIMFEGMLRADSHFGDFTGVALENYFSASADDPLGARKIINGTDHADDIAKIYRTFLEALS